MKSSHVEELFLWLLGIILVPPFLAGNLQSVPGRWLPTVSLRVL